MKKYILQRLWGAVVTLFIVITISFFMMRAAPGGPFSRDRAYPPEVLKNIEAKYNLDKPLLVQYGIYLKRVVINFDLGPSTRYADRSVNELIASGFVYSAKIGLGALVTAVLIGLLSGLIASLRHNKPTDYIVMTFAMIGVSIPDFVLANLLILIFALGWNLLPVAGVDSWVGYILPSVTLGLIYASSIARLTRGGMLEILGQDFIRTARAKGLSKSRILWRHTLKGGLLPTVTYLGPATAGMLTGSLIVEKFFNIPGLGRFLIDSAVNRDYTLSMGCVIVFVVILLPLNILVDFLYAFMDPGWPMTKSDKPRSLWRDAMKRLLKNKASVAGLIFFVAMTVAAVFGPHYASYSFEEQDYDRTSNPPFLTNFEKFETEKSAQIQHKEDFVSFAGLLWNSKHWLGTDELGRDLLVRILTGARVSLAVGFLAALVSLVVGIFLGALAGYMGGFVDAQIVRLIDILYSIPYMFFVILLMSMAGRNFYLLFIAIGAVSWLTTARIVRGQVISLKNSEFVEAARASGTSHWGIIFYHLVPNTLGPIIVFFSLLIPRTMLEESFLSYLGLGVQAPMASWGSLVADSQSTITLYPWMVIFPGLALTFTLFSLNFIGDGLRDALDPKLRGKQ